MRRVGVTILGVIGLWSGALAAQTASAPISIDVPALGESPVPPVTLTNLQVDREDAAVFQGRGVYGPVSGMRGVWLLTVTLANPGDRSVWLLPGRMAFDSKWADRGERLNLWNGRFRAIDQDVPVSTPAGAVAAHIQGYVPGSPAAPVVEVRPKGSTTFSVWAENGGALTYVTQRVRNGSNTVGVLRERTIKTLSFRVLPEDVARRLTPDIDPARIQLEPPRQGSLEIPAGPAILARFSSGGGR